MKQTVEEAAKECRRTTAQSMGVYAQYHSIDECPNHGITYDEIAEAAFIKGAEWQAKQFPWISTKDKLPDDEDLVITGCWCTDYFKYLQQGWYCRECNEWYDTNGDKICVTHWMPILDLRNSINRAFMGRIIIKKI